MHTHGKDFQTGSVLAFDGDDEDHLEEVKICSASGSATKNQPSVLEHGEEYI